MSLIDIFLMFFRIGLFSFGGGYTVISLLQKELVSNNLIRSEDFINMVAISQITPGAVAINIATFVGFNNYLFVGAVIATLGIVLPSLLIVIFVIKFITKFKSSTYVRDLLKGLSPAIVGLIFVAFANIAKIEFIEGNSINFKVILISLISYLCISKFKIKIGIVILIFGTVSILIF